MIEVLDELPRSSTGKILRNELRARVRKGRQRALAGDCGWGHCGVDPG